MTFRILSLSSLFLLGAVHGGRGEAVSSPTEGEDAVVHPEFSEDAVAFFQTEVRPLLAENCLRCHGGADRRGEVKVRSGLQLISRLGILRGGDHGPAFDPGDPPASLLLQMVSYRDEDHQMPPSGKLSDEDLDTLRKWVEMGLPWTPEDANLLVEVEESSPVTEINEVTRSHWSYRPMTRPEVPAVDDGAASPDGNAIDAFIDARLADAGLQPNPPAERGELVRRAYYDLLGLAPSPEEVRAFVEDDAPDAWPRLVERLLASPHYGEKWGRHWLDVVRYAESNGFERDSEKPFMWRYRDYVIDSFNRDKPYDRFLQEQLAGDEIAPDSPEALIATGYHRLMQWDDEPADPLQHKYDVLDDNVRTTAEGMLGMTLGCARCHDHKGDPMSQADYFRFMAFFHGISPMGKESILREVRLPPDEEDIARWQRESARRLTEIRREMSRIERRAERAMREREPSRRGDADPTQGPVLIADGANGGAEWHYRDSSPPEGWSAVGFRPGDDWAVGRSAFGSPADPARSDERGVTAWTGDELWLQTSFRLDAVPEAAYFTIRGGGRAEIHLNGQRIGVFREPGSAGRLVPLDAAGLSTLQTGRNVVAVHLRRGDDRGGDGHFDLGLTGGNPSGEASVSALLLAGHADDLLPEDAAARYRALAGERERLSRPEPAGVMAVTVEEMGPHPPQLHIHIRGNAVAEGEPVEPGFPRIFGDVPVNLPEPDADSSTSGRRSALARWITAPDNPRTARVMVNRIWQHHFGRGISPTPNDFGFLGEPATHPELLDWLATEFVDRGWSIKEMHRLVMASAAYRHSSRGDPVALERDPQNLLFWRFDMRRLSAEEIRDSILAVAGLLNREVGGESVYVPLPPEVLATSSKGADMWGTSPLDQTRRRSVYIKVKRSLIPPQLTDFDFADTDASCPVRFSTTVPTQALGFLNSAFMNEHATLFADRLRREHPGDLRAQVGSGFALAVGRDAAPSEVATGLEFIDTMRDRHGLDEAAALDRFCLLVLNLNEFIYLD